MPVFHFNASNGHPRPDQVGTELPGLEQARCEALRHFGELMIDKAMRAENCDDLCLEVTDHAGLILFTLMMSRWDAPVLLR